MIGTLQRRFKSTIPRIAVTPNKFNPKASAFNAKVQFPEGLHLFPAQAAPSAVRTPNIFLPEEDPRRDNEIYNFEQSYIKENIGFMPIIDSGNKPSYHLTAEEIKEMRRLRFEEKYTRKQLKDKFQVSDYFIKISTKMNPQAKAEHVEKILKSKSKWCDGREKASRDRNIRQKMWLRDEY